MGKTPSRGTKTSAERQHYEHHQSKIIKIDDDVQYVSYSTVPVRYDTRHSMVILYGYSTDCMILYTVQTDSRQQPEYHTVYMIRIIIIQTHNAPSSFTVKQQQQQQQHTQQQVVRGGVKEARGAKREQEEDM